MSTLSIISWNMKNRSSNWETVLESGADVALLQETSHLPGHYDNRQTPETAARQLDYVFASESIADRVKVRALNNPEEWGPSDHCRIMIELGS